MKRHSILVMVMVAVFLAASAGLAAAGGAWHSSGMSGEEEMGGSRSSSEEAAGGSGDWSWYYEGPVETGTISDPPPSGVTFGEESPSPDESIAVSESGGLLFREGIDTQ